MKRNSQIFLSVVCGLFLLFFLLSTIDCIISLSQLGDASGFPEPLVKLFVATKGTLILYLISDIIGMIIAGIGVYQFAYNTGNQEHNLPYIPFILPLSRIIGIIILYFASKNVYPDFQMSGVTIALLIIYAVIVITSVVSIYLSRTDSQEKSYIGDAVAFVLLFVCIIISLIDSLNEDTLTVISMVFLIITTVSAAFGSIFAYVTYHDNGVGKQHNQTQVNATVSSANVVHKENPENNLSIEEKLTKIKDLRDKGLINDADYEAKKKDLLEKF